ncbi:hypothetical protein BRC88_02830 [Halobacteriales archaeon QS_4_69_225]|nr:MAG: hypothetical protein BRC88_02830 [Halobacteriales archaeon QS_4_69_225]
MFDLFPDLADYADAKAGHLSDGRQQMVALAQGLAPDPDTLLLDEPVQGLAVEFVEEVEDEQEAIEKVNDTRFGLAANLWTEDRERSQRLARDIDAGYVYINKMTNTGPRVPFGGIKNAGYDRELFKSSIKEFVNRKPVWTQ